MYILDLDAGGAEPVYPDLAYAWGMLLLLDISLFTMTLAKVLRNRREWYGQLYRIILRDGECHYLVFPKNGALYTR